MNLFFKSFFCAAGLSIALLSGLANASNQESLISEEALPSLMKKEKIVPSYQPWFWSIRYSIKEYNNCYNYATNTVTSGRAQPGHASGMAKINRFKDTTCPTMLKRAESDEGVFRYVEGVSLPLEENQTLMALVVAPGHDYHWYRRDANGSWSHKVGRGTPSDKDTSNKLIEDPELADRGFYTDFCGYFYTESLVSENDKLTGDEHYGKTDFYDQGRGIAQVSQRVAPKKNKDDIDAEQTFETEHPLSIEIMKYSGVRNPVLHSVEQLDSVLSDLTIRIKRDAFPLPWQQGSQEFLKPNLGYSGLLLKDNEGLYFSAGTSVFIYENTALIKTADSSGFLKVELPDFIESDILDEAGRQGLLD